MKTQSEDSDYSNKLALSEQNSNKSNKLKKHEAYVLRACPDCDLLQHIPPLKPNRVARCLRCGSVLEKNNKNSVNRSLALALTGLILFFFSNLFPILILKAQGMIMPATLIGSSISLYEDGRPLVAGLVFVTTVILPFVNLVGILFLLLTANLNRKIKQLGYFNSVLCRFLINAEVWGMLEVFMLAVIVAGVKLGDLAEVIPGLALYSFVVMIVILTYLQLTFNQRDIWPDDNNNGIK